MRCLRDEEKVISLYARGMSTRDIHDQLQDLYGIEMSAEMVSKSTDKILPEIREWQSRPLSPVYPFVFMDCIHYKVREDGRILSRAAYVCRAAFYITQRRCSRRKLKFPDWFRYLRECASEYGTLFSLVFSCKMVLAARKKGEAAPS